MVFNLFRSGVIVIMTAFAVFAIEMRVLHAQVKSYTSQISGVRNNIIGAPTSYPCPVWQTHSCK